MSFKDRDDCSKRLLCELNAKYADGQPMEEDEITIALSFGNGDEVDIGEETMDFDIAAVVGKQVITWGRENRATMSPAIWPPVPPDSQNDLLANKNHLCASRFVSRPPQLCLQHSYFQWQIFGFYIHQKSIFWKIWKGSGGQWVGVIISLQPLPRCIHTVLEKKLDFVL